MHDAGWNQPQNRFAALNPSGVSGVMAALKTHHAMRALGEPIDHFAFAFMAPLIAHDNAITTQSVFQRLVLRLCAPALFVRSVLASNAARCRPAPPASISILSLRLLLVQAR